MLVINQLFQFLKVGCSLYWAVLCFVHWCIGKKLSRDSLKQVFDLFAEGLVSDEINHITGCFGQFNKQLTFVIYSPSKVPCMHAWGALKTN